MKSANLNLVLPETTTTRTEETTYCSSQ